MLTVRSRAWRVTGTPVLIALALAGCGLPGGGPAAHGEHAETASGPHAGHDGSDASDDAAAGHEGHGDVEYIVPEGFEEALDEVTTDRGREILSDWLVTAAEVEDLRVAQVDCLAADGFDVDLENGSLQVKGVPDGVADEEVAGAVEACLGDLPVIAPLYATSQDS